MREVTALSIFILAFAFKHSLQMTLHVLSFLYAGRFEAYGTKIIFSDFCGPRHVCKHCQLFLQQEHESGTMGFPLQKEREEQLVRNCLVRGKRRKLMTHFHPDDEVNPWIVVEERGCQTVGMSLAVGSAEVEAKRKLES